MAKDPREQQRTDAKRVGEAGTGKLDRDVARDREVAEGTAKSQGARREVPVDEQRARLTRERDAAIEHLRRLGISPEIDENAPRGAGDTPRDEGDQAQASERQDLAYATRERLAERINQLSAALGRIEDGIYGQCTECGEPIEPARLAALPEAETCLRCQERREQAETERAA
jgi:DnaK suppressor protein